MPAGRRQELNMKWVREWNGIEVATAPTRREALRVGGGAALAALLAAGLGWAADDASPSPADGGGLAGRYAVVRLRKLKAGRTAVEVMARIDEGFVPLVRAIPGFVLYFGSADPETGDLAYVGVFADRAGADESTRRAGEWLAANAYDFFDGDPVVAEGAVAIAAAASAA
jgi:hypothetical protein